MIKFVYNPSEHTKAFNSGYRCASVSDTRCPFTDAQKASEWLAGYERFNEYRAMNHGYNSGFKGLPKELPERFMQFSDTWLKNYKDGVADAGIEKHEETLNKSLEAWRDELSRFKNQNESMLQSIFNEVFEEIFKKLINDELDLNDAYNNVYECAQGMDVREFAIRTVKNEAAFAAAEKYQDKHCQYPG